MFLAVAITFFAHMSNDIKAEITSIFIFTVMFASHSHESFSQADKADRKRAVLNHIT